MRLLLLGAKGMLGQDVARAAQERGWQVIATDRDELDITDADQVTSALETHRPDAVVNCAAYNFVDRVEEPEVYALAHKINALGPEYLAKASKRTGAKFLHFSTDYVFAGEKKEGYAEDDEPQPISAYGETKREGETRVLDVGGNVYICRLSKIFGSPGAGEHSKESFVSLMRRLAKEKPELSVVDEEVGTPSYTVDIAEAAFDVLEGTYAPGIYHIVNSGGGVTWYEFAKEIFALTGDTIPVKPVLSSEFPKPAKRPKFAELKNTKIPALRPRREALKDFLSD